MQNSKKKPPASVVFRPSLRCSLATLTTLPCFHRLLGVSLIPACTLPRCLYKFLLVGVLSFSLVCQCPLPTPRVIRGTPANLSGLAQREAPPKLADCPQLRARGSVGRGANVSGATLITRGVGDRDEHMCTAMDARQSVTLSHDTA